MITFYPRAGDVLMCDFEGYRAPEIVKCRPVVVISPKSLIRKNLCTVVPLSSTPPSPVQPYHYRLPDGVIPGPRSKPAWAKCDLVATVCYERLDRIKVSRGNYQTGRVGREHIKALRTAAAIALGIEVAPR